MAGSDIIEGFEREVLAANAPLAALLEASATDGASRLRVLGERIDFPAWPGATSASALRRAAKEAEVTAVLDEYAVAARELIRPADQARWQALVREGQQRLGAGLLVDELGRSALGASLLRERLGARPPRAPQRGPIDCACGYAIDGILPKVLCPECGDVLLRRWVAEERRLLRGLPSYAAEVSRVIEVTAQKQAAISRSGGDDLASEVSARRRAGGRRLGRLRRAHRTEAAALDLRRWSSFIEPLSREARTGVRSTAAKAERRGLGAAALTELSLLSDVDAVRVAARILERRRNSRWKL